ncbi:MAG: DUF1439 domain-containing protein [Rubrivivax sp.]
MPLARRCTLLARTGAVVALLAAGQPCAHAQAPPSYTVSAEQLQQVVTQRFPLRYPVAGLLTLDLQAPRLRLLPEQNRVSAEMTVEAAGPALNQSRAGTFEMDFALRYEPHDHTIRATGLKFRNLRIPDLRPEASDWLNAFGPALAEGALQEVVLHQMRPQDLALMDGLGVQPGRITVTDKGLVIGLVPKPL